MEEFEVLSIKSEGVKDCVKWLENRIKDTNTELHNVADYGYEATELRIRLKEQMELKRSIEKYMKKLRHEARESRELEASEV